MKSTLKIKKNNVFRYILKKGRYAKGNYIVVHVSDKKVIKSQQKDTNYLGICVSKKNGNSVNRNKLKRWVREVYKNEENKLKKGYNIVFLYKKTTVIDNLNYNLIKEDIVKSLKELEIYE